MHRGGDDLEVLAQMVDSGQPGVPM
jgi:hypothetical protein